MIESLVTVVVGVCLVLGWMFYKFSKILDDQSRAYRKMRNERNNWKFLYENFTGESKMDWVATYNALPEVVYESDGGVNCVLVRYKPENTPEAGSQYQVSNTVYVNKHPEYLTHWCYIEEPEVF